MMWCQRATAALCRSAMFGMRLITSISSPQRCTNSNTSSWKPASFICRNCRLNKGSPETSGKSKVFGENKCSWWRFYMCWPQFLTCRGQMRGKKGIKSFFFKEWITSITFLLNCFRENRWMNSACHWIYYPEKSFSCSYLAHPNHQLSCCPVLLLKDLTVVTMV